MALLLCSCSLTVAQGFDECRFDTDCRADATCMQKYCIPLPEGCTRGPGEFKAADKVAWAGILPLTDANGARDESEYAGLNAFTQALEEMNQRGGANGRLFALYLCDSKRDPERTKAQAAWMTEQLKIPALLASGSQQCIKLSEATTSTQPLILSATATSPELVTLFSSNAKGLLWRTAPPDTLQGRVLANLLLSDPTYAGASRVGILYVDDAYGQGLQSELSRRLTSKTVVTAPFTSGQDVSASVAALGGTTPVNVTVVIGVTADTKRILTTALARREFTRDAGHRWAFADGSKDPDILTVPGATAQLAGSLGTAPAQGAGRAFPTFRSAYRVKFNNQDPSDYSYTSHSYDAMYLLGLATSYATSQDRTLDGHTLAAGLSKVVSTGNAADLEPAGFSALRNAISQGQNVNVEGASGHLDFIPDAGAPSSLIEIWRVEPNGGFTTVTLIDPPPT